MNNTDHEQRFAALLLETNLAMIDETINQCTDDFSPSKSFTKKMHRIINGKGMSTPTLHLSLKKKIIIALAAILILVLAGCVSVKHDVITGFVKEYFSTHLTLTYTLSEDQIENRKELDEEEYILSYVPDRYTQTNYEKSSGLILTEWKDSRGRTLRFSQYVMQAFYGSYDTETSKFETIVIDNVEIYHSDSSGFHCFLWIENGYIFLLTIQKPIEDEEVTAIMQGITRK